MESLNYSADGIVFLADVHVEEGIKENIKSNHNGWEACGDDWMSVASNAPNSPTKSRRPAQSETFFSTVIEERIHHEEDLFIPERVLNERLLNAGETPPPEIDLRVFAAIAPYLKWIHHLFAPADFCMCHSVPNHINPLSQDDYVLKIARSPHLQNINKVFSRFEDETFAMKSSFLFADWTEERRHHAKEKLRTLNMPLNPFFTDLVYQILQNHEEELCENPEVNYPAKFEVITVRRSETEQVSWDSFELEIHADHRASLLFLNNKETFIAEGSYKKVWKLFALDEPSLKVHSVSLLHFDSEKADKIETSRVHTYHTIAKREEESFKCFKDCSWIAKVRDIFYFSIICKGVNYQQQIIEMEYYPNELFNIIGAKLDDPIGAKISVKEKLSYSIRILQVVADIHRHGRIHRDLKPENFLMDSESKLFLTDFGLCMVSAEPCFSSSKAGTPAYLPPEVLFLSGRRYSYEIDIWSTGCLLWLLWFDEPYPWFDEMLKDKPNFLAAKRQMIKYDKQPIHLHDIRAENPFSRHPIRILIKDMLKYEPEERTIRASDALDRLQCLLHIG